MATTLQWVSSAPCPILSVCSPACQCHACNQISARSLFIGARLKDTYLPSNPSPKGLFKRSPLPLSQSCCSLLFCALVLESPKGLSQLLSGDELEGAADDRWGKMEGCNLLRVNKCCLCPHSVVSLKCSLWICVVIFPGITASVTNPTTELSSQGAPPPPHPLTRVPGNTCGSHVALSHCQAASRRLSYKTPLHTGLLQLQQVTVS